MLFEMSSFTESVASECEEYYTDSSYFYPIETTTDEDDASHLADPVDFTEADLDALLLEEKEIDGPTELRQFLAKFFSRTKTSGVAATSFLKGAKRLDKQKNVFDAHTTAHTTLKTLVNVDGLPLFKSSTTSFLPILVKVRGQHSPFSIGV